MTPKIYPVIHHLDDSTTINEAAVARDAGADGVFLISHHGRNSDLTRLACHLKSEYDMRVGVNYLGWPNMRALDEAAMSNIDMLWLDAPGVSSAGISVAARLFLDRLSHYAGDAPEIFASVAFKYQQPEADPERAAMIVRQLGDSFVPTTSGAATGEAPPLLKIQHMSDYGAQRLAIASGMTPDNVAQFAPFLSHILVATGVSKDEHHFDYEKLSQFVRIVRAL